MHLGREMIGWWFGDYMWTTEHYKRWHPRDHVWMSWEHKQPGTHVGARHLVHEYIGSRLHKLCITFVPPAEFFGRALAVHCHEEMSTLAGFLPDLYASESQGP